MPMKSLARTVLIAFLLSALAFASYAQDAPEANLTDSCVENYDAEVDYFPDKVAAVYANNFVVEYFNNYKIVTMLPWPGAEEALEYVLVQCGTPAPEGYDESAIFEVPVNSFVATSTSMLPHLDEQGLLDRLVAVDTTLFTSNEDVLALVESGDVAEIGGGGSGGDINFELLLNLEPELVMAQEFYAGGTTLSQLQEAGIPSVLNADYADTSPLGQAEWGKYIAVFFNTEAEANELFDAVEGTYQELTALAADVEERPTAITASPYSGTWYMPGADSTIAQLLADAGADFLFADQPGTSVPLDVEVVVENGAEAEYWVNANQFWGTIDDMLADEPRFADFAAVESGNVWNNNLRTNANGGSDYFESGAAHPELILADLIAIFHPDLLPDHEFTYYQQLASAE
ncbi:MAG: ABC transporter substrate-binding protein [Anaerolineaceae bacterium]|nr:ABC transporter substrate-binding protein [Anaerolineaceae bacterium]